jgi:chromosome segregation ATPase
MAVDWTALLIGVFGGGSLSAVLATYFQRAKYTAQARKLEMEASESRVGSLKEFIDWQRIQIVNYQQEIVVLREKISCLEKLRLEDRMQIRNLEEEVGALREKVKEMNGDCG